MHNWKRCHVNGIVWRLSPFVSDTMLDRLAVLRDERGDIAGVELLKRDLCHVVKACDGLVLKKVTPRPGCLHGLRFALRPARFARACRYSLELRAAGVPVAEPLAYGQTVRFGLKTAELMVTRRIEEVGTLTHILTGDSSRREKLLEPYGTLLGMFHRNGFSNRDLKDGNVLCSRSGDASLWVADMDGVRRCLRLSRFRSARDWWPIIRSLAVNDCADDESLARVLRGYNAAVPARLKWRNMPWFCEHARRAGRPKMVSR